MRRGVEMTPVGSWEAAFGWKSKGTDGNGEVVLGHKLWDWRQQLQEKSWEGQAVNSCQYFKIISFSTRTVCSLPLSLLQLFSET